MSTKAGADRFVRFGIGAAAAVAAAWFPGAALAQLRVANWNVTNYSSGRVTDFQTAIYGVVPVPLPLAGRSLSPDIILGEEFVSAAGVGNFLSLLNTAPGSPGDWAAAPFIDGPDSDSAFFYRTSKIAYIGTTIISQVTGSTSLPPRNTYRYDMTLKGYAVVPGTRLACYATHMKAGSSPDDQARRLLEANKIRDNAAGFDTNGAGTALPGGVAFLLGGDFNIQSSGQAAYQRLVGSETNNAGRLFDPIVTPGSWNNNGTYSFVHTQDPSTTGTGGMDDRHDQILLCSALIDGDGFDYFGNPAAPYSTTTWNDPNHSYRCWGNDGTSFDTPLRTFGNTMVGPAIAQALINTANAGGTSGGHLPVVLELRVPPVVATSGSAVDFGVVRVGQAASADLGVSNAGDTARWTAPGIAPLTYSLSAPPGFTAPGGTFTALAGAGPNTHTLGMSTLAPGPLSGTLILSDNDPASPVVSVNLAGLVLCGADFNADTTVDDFDYFDFLNAFFAPDLSADVNGDTSVDDFDYFDFLNAFFAPCP
ncbi:MAG: hypothetical protein JNM07_10020 [Phycisphaerae bacterium]|nr:hypothetical protein [Phycisphaerae bacterium]